MPFVNDGRETVANELTDANSVIGSISLGDVGDRFSEIDVHGVTVEDNAAESFEHWRGHFECWMKTEKSADQVAVRTRLHKVRHQLRENVRRRSGHRDR